MKYLWFRLFNDIACKRLVSGYITSVLCKQRLLEKGYFLTVVFAVVPFGSVYSFLAGFICGCFATLAGLAQLLPGGSEKLEYFIRGVSIAIFAFFGLIVFQAYQFVGNPFANPVWAGPVTEFGEVAGAISVNPAATQQAMVTLAIPCFATLAALRIFRDDDSALRLWHFLAYFGTIIVFLTLLQYLVMPKTVLFYDKWAYNLDYTLTFVNRNTAATTVGLIFFLNIALLIYKSIDRPNYMHLARLIYFDLGIGYRRKRWLFHAGACFLILIGLVLTRSRGGLGATFIAGIVVLSLMLARSPPTFMQNRSMAWAVTAAIAVSAMVAFLMLFAGLAVDRVEQDGLVDMARLCTYESIYRAIGDRWLLGWGFGTFADVFPSYRVAACTGINGVWDRAHNSYLECIMGTGLLGGLVLIYLVILIAFTLLQGLKSRRSMKVFSSATIGIFVLVLLHSFVDFSIQIPGFAVLASSSIVSGLVISSSK